MRLVTRALALAFAFTAVAAPGAAAAQEVSIDLAPGETLLEVEAEGVSANRPDVMTIAAGIETTGPTASEALRRNNEVANRLLEVIRSRRVDARDIRTTILRVRPQYERERPDDDGERERRIIGYSATNTLELRLRDLTRAPELLDALLSAGANNVSGPSFSLSEERPARLAAQRAAVELARQEAENFAAALGMRVTRVLRVSERSRDRGNEYDNYITVTGSRIGPGPPIEPGELETRVTVWVDFALAPR